LEFSSPSSCNITLMVDGIVEEQSGLYSSPSRERM